MVDQIKVVRGVPNGSLDLSLCIKVKYLSTDIKLVRIPFECKVL